MLTASLNQIFDGLHEQSKLQLIEAKKQVAESERMAQLINEIAQNPEGTQKGKTNLRVVHRRHTRI